MSSTASIRTFLLAAGLLLLPTQAAQADGQAKKEAAAAHQRGVAAYNEQRFDDATAAFERAYDLDPAPSLLFNIAQSYWKKGDAAAAARHYRRYLEARPKAPNRAQVEQRIRELEAPSSTPPPRLEAPASPEATPRAVLEPRPAQPARSILEEHAPPSSPPAPSRRRGWLWAAGAAVVVGTAALLVAAPWRDDSVWSCSDCTLATYGVPQR